MQMFLFIFSHIPITIPENKITPSLGEWGGEQSSSRLSNHESVLSKEYKKKKKQFSYNMSKNDETLSVLNK